jgi:hypothetical protein
VDGTEEKRILAIHSFFLHHAANPPRRATKKVLHKDRNGTVILSRRRFSALLIASLSSRAFSEQPPQTQPAGRNLDFEIDPKGFGDAVPADIEAVIRSAADSIWQDCPNTRWEEPGFHVYHSRLAPITLDAHRPDGRIAIGLAAQDEYWAQFAFQFAHEFCHALAGHSNDWRKCWITQPKANHWLEESLCETASLFALRAMGKSWQRDPPYPNWTGFAPKLTKYAADRLAEAAKDLPPERSFVDWLHENEPAMRQDPVIRPKNNIVAMNLLPLLEATPSGWEAVTFYNLVPRDPQKSLAAQISDWKSIAPAEQKPFIAQVAGILGL